MQIRCKGCTREERRLCMLIARGKLSGIISGFLDTVSNHTVSSVSVALPALPPPASPPSLTRSGAEPRGRERDFCQGSAQATAQTHPALPEPPLGAPAVPSGLNAASGAGGASV